MLSGPDSTPIDIDLDLNLDPFMKGVEKVVAAAEDLGDKISSIGDRMDNEMAKPVSSAFGKMADSAKAVGSKIKSAFESAFDAVKQIIVTRIAFATNIIPQVLDVGKMSEMASTYQQQLALLHSSFGSLDADAQHFADTIGRVTGTSRTALTGFMATTGSMFASMGFQSDQAEKFSEALTKVAVNVSTVTGAEQKDVQNAFLEGITGRAEGLRKYGVVLTSAAVDAELFKMGVQGGTSAATDQEMALARLNAMIESTRDMEDNAAAASDTFANRMDDIRALVEDLQIEFGQKLNDAVLKAIDSLGGLDKAKELLRGAYVILVDVATEVIDLGAKAVKAGIDWVDSIGGVKAGLLTLASWFERLKAGLYSVEYLGKAVLVGLSATMNGLVGIFGTIWDVIKSVGNAIMFGLVVAVEYATAAVAKLLHGMAAITPDALGGKKLESMADSLDSFVKSADSKADEFKKNMKDDWNDIGQTWTEVANSIQSDVDSLDFDATTDAIYDASNAAKNYWEQAQIAAKNYADEAKRAKAETDAMANDPAMNRLETFSLNQGAGGSYLGPNGDALLQYALHGAPIGGAQGAQGGAGGGSGGGGAGGGAPGAPGASYGAPLGYFPSEAGAPGGGSVTIEHYRSNYGGSGFSIEPVSQSSFSSAPSAGDFGPSFSGAGSYSPSSGGSEDFGPSFTGSGNYHPAASSLLFEQYASGGMVKGPGGIDRVPAFLTAGEFVVRREAVAMHLPMLRALNDGGFLKTTAATMAPLGSINATFNISTQQISPADVETKIIPALRRLARQGVRP